jgi:cell division protein FtsL
LALVIVLVFALGIIISIFYSRVLITGYQITRLQEELAEMEKETRSLAEEVSRLSSLERVEVVATTRLGMVKPGEDQVLLVKATGDSRERQQESRPATKPGPGGEERPRNAGEHHWILQALTDLVMHRLSG